MKTILNALISTFTGNANDRELLITFGVLMTIATIVVSTLLATGVIHLRSI